MSWETGVLTYYKMPGMTPGYHKPNLWTGAFPHIKRRGRNKHLRDTELFGFSRCKHIICSACVPLKSSAVL